MREHLTETVAGRWDLDIEVRKSPTRAKVDNSGRCIISSTKGRLGLSTRWGGIHVIYILGGNSHDRRRVDN